MFRTDAPESTPIVQTRRYPQIRWTDREGSAEVVARKRIVVGSSGASDVVIHDPTVSRVHALLEPKGDGILVRDLDSRNGTLVNGQRIREAMVTTSSDLVLGGTVVRVDFDSALLAPIEVWPHERFHHLVGSSMAMRELFALLARVGPTDASVLIQGETGTGKELVARSIHAASNRVTGPFVVVDCAALPENLLDAELFGHTKGAFTGATSARLGAIESANGGTVFLDEIGELPISMQPKLLRVLEQRTVRRLGEAGHRAVDVRIISATHRNLLEMVAHGTFREDLYFRLCVIPVSVPPLRERPEDIDILVRHFLDGESLSPSFAAALREMPWRGNVRELRNHLDRVRALGEGAAEPVGTDAKRPMSAELRAATARRPTLAPKGPAELPSLGEPDDAEGTQSTVWREVTPPSMAPPPPSTDYGAPTGVPMHGQFKIFRENWIEYGEREYLRALVERHARNMAGMAKEADVDRTYLYRMIKKHKL